MRTKKLVKPIRAIIAVRIRTWWDKANGNTYFSARAVVNGDYEHEVVLGMQYGCSSHAESEVRKALIAQYPRLEDKLMSGNLYAITEGMAYSVSYEEGTKRDCKRFGEPSPVAELYPTPPPLPSPTPYR